jgi:RNAse (barnase) inhibitor barstar
MSDDETLSRTRPWVHELSADPASEVVRDADARGVLVIQLDGSKMRSVEELFREYVREFRFPEFFGWNWDAFDECMTVLEALPAHAYLTLIRNPDQLLRDEPTAGPTFRRLLEDIGQSWANSFALDEKWGGGDVPFNTILVREVSAPAAGADDVGLK